MKNIILSGLALSLVGCMNMPTQPSQITGSYTSGLRYENFNCSQLASEANSLARRENQLVIAQEQRIKTSTMQAMWWGYGQGDSVEASELANVRGEKEAVRHAIESKDCRIQGGYVMWFVIFAFAVLAYLIIKQEKTFNKSILILEERINSQQHQINKLNERVSDLEASNRSR